MRHSEISAHKAFPRAAVLAAPYLLTTMALLSGCGDADTPDAAPTEGETRPPLTVPDVTTENGLIQVPGSPSPIDDDVDESAEPRPLARPAISAPFRGRWAVSLSECRAVPGLDRIVVGASEIKFGDANGIPLSVTQAGERAIVVKLRIMGQGGKSERIDRLTIDPDGITLLYRRGDEPLTYRRCPK